MKWLSDWIEKIGCKILKRPYFPKEIKNLWLAGRYFASRLDNVEFPYLMPYYDFTDLGLHKVYKRGDFVPVFEKDGFVAFYVVTSVVKDLVGDLPYWDDGRIYELALFDVSKVKPEALEKWRQKVNHKNETSKYETKKRLAHQIQLNANL